MGRSTERAKTLSTPYRSTVGQHDLIEKETEVLETTSHFRQLNICVASMEVTIFKKATDFILLLSFSAASEY